MEARFIGFGEIEIDGRRYDHDIVIDGGRVAKRAKKASKKYKGRYGHTPLSVDEDLPWGRGRLIIGTGASGALPIMPEVEAAAKERGDQLVALPTEQALELLREMDGADVHAVVHVTC